MLNKFAFLPELTTFYSYFLINVATLHVFKDQVCWNFFVIKAVLQQNIGNTQKHCHFRIQEPNFHVFPHTNDVVTNESKMKNNEQKIHFWQENGLQRSLIKVGA